LKARMHDAVDPMLPAEGFEQRMMERFRDRLVASPPPPERATAAADEARHRSSDPDYHRRCWRGSRYLSRHSGRLSPVRGPGEDSLFQRPSHEYPQAFGAGDPLSNNLASPSDDRLRAADFRELPNVRGWLGSRGCL
jgi:hypothetical protein